MHVPFEVCLRSVCLRLEIRSEIRGDSNSDDATSSEPPAEVVPAQSERSPLRPRAAVHFLHCHHRTEMLNTLPFDVLLSIACKLNKARDFRGFAASCRACYELWQAAANSRRLSEIEAHLQPIVQLYDGFLRLAGTRMAGRLVWRAQVSGTGVEALRAHGLPCMAGFVSRSHCT